MKPIFACGVIGLSLMLSGCGVGAKSSAGFRLPDGDAGKGKAAFVALQCHTCHTVAGETELPAPSSTVKAPVLLGGEVAKVTTYGALVTSIIHPAHNLSAQLQKEWMEEAKLSPMGSFNHVMTVEQMIDLVAYLHPKYKQLTYYHDYDVR
jgi:mono/diheme cytochrome c family protein